MVTQWLLKFSFTRFNSKHEVLFNDRNEAKRVAEHHSKKGIWVKQANGEEVYWGPEAIGKISVSLIEPEPERTRPVLTLKDKKDGTEDDKN